MRQAVVLRCRLETSVRIEVKIGPLDLQKQRELDEIESRVTAASQKAQFDFSFVDDCTEAAILARSLELPRIEVEGRFLRAVRIAKKYGTQHQRLVAAYQTAWTAYWWFEDYESFADLYDDAEREAVGSTNAYKFRTSYQSLVHPSYAYADRQR